LAPAVSINMASEISSVDLIRRLARRFPLPWSHDVRLLKVEKPQGRAFYEAETLRAAGRSGNSNAGS
jgi:hypothetical protein